MLSVYVPHGLSLERLSVEPGRSVPDAAIWFDLVTPTKEAPKAGAPASPAGVRPPTRPPLW